MKKNLILILILGLLMSVLPFSALSVSAEEYISTPVDISGKYSLHAMVDFGKTFKANYSTLTSYASGNHFATIIDINDMKANEALSWKSSWIDGIYANTATFNGIDYKMTVKSAEIGMSAMGLSDRTVYDFSVTPGSYTKVSILANSHNGVGSYANYSLPMGVVLNYSDGTKEYQKTKNVYYAFSEATGYTGFQLKSIKLSGSGWSMNNVTAETQNNTAAPIYIYEYSVPVDSLKTLNGITFLGTMMKATDNGDGTVSIEESSDRVHTSANVFAVTAVTTNEAIKQGFKNSLDEIIKNFEGYSIMEDYSFFMEMQYFIEDAKAANIDIEDLLKDYQPYAKDAAILGKYEANADLSVDYDVVSPFGLQKLSESVKWYKTSSVSDKIESDWEFLGEGSTYKLKPEDIGSYIYASISAETVSPAYFPEIPVKCESSLSLPFYYATAPTAENVYFKDGRIVESTYEGERLSLNYRYVDFNGDEEAGTIFTFEIADKYDGTYTTLKSGTENFYDVLASDNGKFIKCSVKPANAAEKGDEAAFYPSDNVIYVQSDKNAFGTKIDGEYGIDDTFVLLSDDEIPDGNRDCSEYQWYITSDITGSFPDSWTLTGDNTPVYTLDTSDAGKYIAVVYTPKYTDGENVTQKDSVSMFIYEKAAPVCYGVTLKNSNEDLKTVKSGDELSVSYKYLDTNNDPLDRIEIIWQTSTDKENWHTTDNKTDKYVLTENDKNVYIRSGVKAFNSAEKGDEGEYAYSNIIASPFAPVVTNAKITGTASYGYTISADYDFYDENGNADVDSVIKWYRNGIFVGEGVQYKIQASDCGSTMYYEITPKTTVLPQSEKTFVSETVTVPAYYAPSLSGGSFSGGSGGSTSGGIKSYVSTPSASEEYDYTNKYKVDFTDINGHWAEKSIIYVNEKGYMNGYGTEFIPNNNITRGEVAAVIYRILDMEHKYKECFSDIKEDSWYADYVYGLYREKLVNGDENKNFNPDSYITRQEAAKIFAGAYKLKMKLRELEKGDIEDFSDSDKIAKWAEDFVAEAYKLGLMSGDENKSFNPEKNLTRGEAAIIIERFIGLTE